MTLMAAPHSMTGASDAIVARIRDAIPTIDTVRLTLRPARQSDFDAYAEFRASDRAIGVGGPNPRPEAYIRFSSEPGLWLLRGYGGLVIADRTTDAPMGIAGFYQHAGWAGPEIGWALFDGHEGRGYATEAARALCRFAFDTLGWDEVRCSVRPGNPRSEAVALRLGATPTGTDPDGVSRFVITPETLA